MQKGLKLLFGVTAAVFMLSGCASVFFPDFDDDNTEVVIDDGGKVQEHKVTEKGILVADKENAAYEDDEEEKITPAKIIEVKADEVQGDTIKTVEGNFEDDATKEDPSSSAPSMRYLAETIYFNNGSSVVDSKYQRSLREIAQIAKKNKATVTVCGFASSRTRNTDPVTHKLANFKVSAERAENTAKALRRLGVASEQIEVQALSDSVPMYQEIMPEGERLNRRAEIYLTY